MARSERDGAERGDVPAESPLPLPDRTLIVRRLTEALARAGTATAVLLVDVDDFRSINATRGHSVGDRLLVALGARLGTAVSARETVVRSGDDEFVVICEDTDEHSAHALACLLRNILAEPFCIEGAAVRLTASIGVAAAPARDGVPASDLLRHADTAVRAGKEAGRGRVHLYDRALGEAEADRYALGAELLPALAADALHLEYQPIVDLCAGAVVGVEALVRWTHPERGPVPAGSFVGVAEAIGVAPELDRWVVRHAVQDMAHLRLTGLVPDDAYLAVNLSAASLTDALLSDHLVGWTRRCALPARLLVLEVTETALMHDPRAAARVLGHLREQGFRVAMDDFGTGYSSLAHLRDLPISALKIDRSFVADIGRQRDALAIVAWIIDLARTLGVDVVAEGVETAEQAALLRGHGCVSGQGWLWGAAAPPSALPSRDRARASAP